LTCIFETFNGELVSWLAVKLEINAFVDTQPHCRSFLTERVCSVAHSFKLVEQAFSMFLPVARR